MLATGVALVMLLESVQDLHRKAGAPALAQMRRYAWRQGHTVSRSALWTLLNGRGVPRLETLEAFVAACAGYAGSRRPPVRLSREDVDLATWRERHEIARLQRCSERNPRERAVTGSPRQQAPAAVTQTLPPDCPWFTGRDGQLRAIREGATVAAGAPGGGAVVITINGMPGIGKTALATHAAHQLADLYQDRRLYVDLRAHCSGQQATPPETVLAGLLVADGVPPASLPKDRDGLTALWRDRMTDKRAMLVLDDAADSRQVLPLLLTGPGSLVLVTSRKRLGDLPGAVTVCLDPLPPDDAQRLFVALAMTGPATGQEVAEIVHLCGCLPLAIKLLARLMTKHPSWTLPDLVNEARHGLLGVSAECTTISAAFELSYQHLPDTRRRFFRRLAAHQGPSFDAFDAADLTGTALAEAAQHLDALHADSLLVEHGYRRYGMHDLIRAFAMARGHRADHHGIRRDAVLQGPVAPRGQR